MAKHSSLIRRGIAALACGALLVTLAPTAAAGLEPTPERDQCFVTEAFAIFLERDATESDIALAGFSFAQGNPRSELIRGLANSNEWLSVQVVGIYDDALDRAPDLDGLAFWIDQLRQGARVNRIAARIYGSAEFYSRAGGTDEAFVEALYDRILGRSADSDGVAYWTDQIAVQGRDGVAAAFFGTLESRVERVNELYLRILGRGPEPAGRDFWAERLRTVNDVELAVQLASSDEFYAQAQVGCLPGNLDRISDGNGPSINPSIPDFQATIAFESTASNLAPDDDNGVSDVFVRRPFVDDQDVFRLTDGNAGSFNPVASDQGSNVTFSSDASDLVPGDTNGHRDIFMADILGQQTTQITEGNGDSYNPAVSGIDFESPTTSINRALVFSSDASNLVDGDTNGQRDIFYRDSETQTIIRLTDGDAASSDPSVSDDGRFVAFTSEATNLVSGDDNGQQDVFIYDTFNNSTTRVTDGDGTSREVSLSDGGAFVAFASEATNLVSGDDNGQQDIFIWDRQADTTSRVTDGDGASSEPTISAGGASIAFASEATNLVSGDDNGQQDIFIQDRIIDRTSQLTDGNAASSDPSIARDGASVTFESAASDLVAGDDNGTTDVFVRLRAGRVFGREVG